MFNKLIVTTLFFCSLNYTQALSQIHCGSVELQLEDAGNNTFTFNDFTSYDSGFPRTTVARLKVRVLNKATIDDLCSWNLTIRVDNNGAPATEWEEVNLYSDGSGQNPLLNILEIRATNDCMTSEDYGNFVALSSVSNILDIIKPMIITLGSDVVEAGSCTYNVNGPGDYLNHYSEYTFKIEIRIKPGMTYNPGTFALSFNFRLEENI